MPHFCLIFLHFSSFFLYFLPFFFLFLSFESWYFGMLYSDRISVGPKAREVASFLLRPILWEAYLPVPNTLATVTGVLMPDKVAKQYGFKQGAFEIAYTSGAYIESIVKKGVIIV